MCFSKIQYSLVTGVLFQNGKPMQIETNLEYMGFPEWLKMKKCFFLFLQDTEASSCDSLIDQT